MYRLDDFMMDVERRNPSEPEFIQAVREVVESVIDTVNDNPKYIQNRILERITEPDRVISFKVEWEDDDGNIRVNRGYRVQFNNALGPYKGGLRFHASVTEGTMKFLAFEQTFKNALTTLPMGGGKGGSDFSPKGKTDKEILRFCKAFMTELYKYIGPDTDVPAGDIGVGGREIGYLYGHYKKIMTENTGVLTGKGFGWGGSRVRPEATGFGTMYFAESMLHENDESMMLQLRASNNDVVKPYAQRFGAEFVPGKKPWEVPVDLAFPCAIQNELDEEDAASLINNGVKYVIETSNMGCTEKASELFRKNHILFAPGKAANAGGVAVSGLEMSQNAMHYFWSSEEVDEKLKGIMKSIHTECVKHGREDNGYIDYVKGANIAGFCKVADAMCDQGC